ncbi:SIS domain-containing protein [Martelella endophytica]|uniref:Fe-S cluster assembly protein HesB n=1 Tax=Martelella endophytica TaxID=1486262 RepID=A0A0D5LTL2_MAREN|nr:SIS domain-containing protein [Martelella endophytica]AJY47320.1 Fe-S cluster assembly protein HesB [Martelella endophytica]
MGNFYEQALDDLKAVFRGLDDAYVENAITVIKDANRISFYGCGREGLQIKGFCMRLFHLGLDVSMVGDMTTPHIGKGDLLVVTAGPGNLPTGMALIGAAKKAGASIMVVTAQPQSPIALEADHLLVIPAQTMANDQGGGVSVLPMGSLFEGAEYVLFEAMVLRLRDVLGETAETMRTRHTNLE